MSDHPPRCRECGRYHEHGECTGIGDREVSNQDYVRLLLHHAVRRGAVDRCQAIQWFPPSFHPRDLRCTLPDGHDGKHEHRDDRRMTSWPAA